MRYGAGMISLTSSRATLRTQGLIFAVCGAVAFSGKAIVAKLMYRLGADPFAVVGLRMLMAFPMFLAMAWWAGRQQRAERGNDADLTRQQWWQILGLGFTGYYLASTLDFMGLKYISASLERAILYLNPTIVLVLSAVFLRQPVRLLQLGAMLLSYSGVVLVWLHDWDAAAMLASHGGSLDAREAITVGSLLVFFSAVSYAVYLMGSGQLVQRLGSMRLVGLASCAACFMALLQWWVVHRATHGQQGAVAQLPWQAWALSLVNATLCTVLPVWLVMRGVQLVGASMASQAGMVGPLSTIWMAAWWLGEPVTWRLMLGTAVVLAGIVILARTGQAGKPAQSVPAGAVTRAKA
ncbi:MAG TPA: DMT family transporter [Aquabacterium sp.]|uniref:DMT family transporter n=1 Tax=Aquabacterium sp. TaxID=1872578 RepID=UPI002E30A0D9|nr:DMT family transporter [Aquabacterium sp.]HEX5357849.1 DMT family transporter [Aquabacterium sp.]